MPLIGHQQEPSYDMQLVPPLQVSDRPLCCEGGELGRKLAAAELEVIHLNEFLKQNTQKYAEDIKKLEEKVPYLYYRPHTDPVLQTSY